MVDHRKRKIKPPSDDKYELFDISNEDISNLTIDKIQQLVNDLRIQRSELVAQNTELKRAQQELVKSRDRYQYLYITMPVGYVILDTNNNILEANFTAVKMLESDWQHLKNSNFTKYVALIQSAQDMFSTITKKVIANRERQDCDLEMMGEYGTMFFAELMITPILNEKNQISQVHIVMIDITERIKSEEALKESEAKTNALIKYAPIGIFEIDCRVNQFIKVNDAMCSLTGYSREELLNMNPMSILNIEGKKLFTERIKHHLAGEKIDESIDCKINKKDGFIKSIKLNISFSQENLYTSSVFVYDVSECKMTEETLSANVKLYLSILHYSRDIIICFNLRTDCFEYISPSIKELVGFSNDEIISMKLKTVASMIHPEDLQVLQATHSLSEKTGQANAKFRLRAKNGDHVWVFDHFSIIKDSAGWPLYRISNIEVINNRNQDETESKYLDENR